MRRKRGTGQIREKVKEDENGIGDRGCRKFEFGGRRGGGAAKQIGEDPESRNFSAKKAGQAPGRKLQSNANSVPADRVKNRAGEDLNRSVGLADRERPRECQYGPGLLSAWQGADVGNPACA